MPTPTFPVSQKTSDLQALLLQCLHTDGALPEPARLAGLDADEWEAFTNLTLRLGLAGPVYGRLNTPERRDLVPVSCRGRIKGKLRDNFLANLRQQTWLGRVLAGCDAAAIPVILIKGLWLAETVYRDLKARPSGDIDLLFHPQDLPRFTAVARDLGFAIPPGVSDLRELALTTQEYALFHGSRRITLDVHWGLPEPGRKDGIAEETFWRRAEWATLAGRPCRTLRLEDHLIYLCFHAADQHGFQHMGPRALLDVARLISAPPRPLDWAEVASRAQELGWSRGVWLVLDLAREHLGAQPPQTVLTALRPAEADDTLIRGAVLAELLNPQPMGENLAPNLVRLTGPASWRERLALIWTRLFPPREEIATYFKTTVDDPALPRLYVRRLRLLLRQHGPKVGQILRRDRARTAELERARIIARWLGQ